MTSQRNLDLATVALFVVMLVLPMFATFANRDRIEIRREVRLPAEWSDIADAAAWANLRNDPAALPAALGAYATDHFGFRGRLLEGYINTTVWGLGVTSTEDVVLGREGWAFLGSEGARESYWASDPFEPAELEIVVEAFIARRRWLADQGIAYILLGAPNKHTVYSDFAPNGFARLGPTRMDQLIAALRDTPVQFVDAREVLTEGRSTAPTYDRLGTHWSSWGAFLAYRALSEAIGEHHPGAVIRTAAEYQRSVVPGGDRGLAGMLGIGQADPSETIRMFPRFRRSAIDLETSEPLHKVKHRPWLSWFSSHNPSVSGPHVALVRDSFGNQLWPFFSETFPRVDYLWPIGMEFALDVQQFIRRHPPDVVVQVFAERRLEGDPVRSLGPALGEPSQLQAQ